MTTGYYLLDHENPNAPLRDDGRRYYGYPTRRSSLRVVVMHTPETLYDAAGPDPTAERIARYFATTGERPVSAHACIDADSIVPCLPASYTAFHVRGYNSSTYGIEHGWSYLDWTRSKARSLEVLRLTGKHLVETVPDIPTEFLTRAEVDSGRTGYTGHSFLDPTRRKDPGSDYPWNVLFGIVDDYKRGEEPDMNLAAARLAVALVWAEELGSWPTAGSDPSAQARLTRVAQEIADGTRTEEDLRASLRPYRPADISTRRAAYFDEKSIPAWILVPGVPSTFDGEAPDAEAARLPAEFRAKIIVEEV